MLTFYVYQTTVINDRLDVYKWIKEYFFNHSGKEEEIFSLLADEESRNIARKRIEFYRTGELKHIKSMPVNLNAYFDHEYYNHISDDEVFVDCGAFDGDTLQGFVDFVANKYQKVYAFEPDKGNYTELLARIKQKCYYNVLPYNCATGLQNGEIFFNELNTTGSFIAEEGNKKVNMKSLDSLITDRVTWIKMDIEGAEMDTLRGAEKIITTYKPKLAVCIYHKCEDMFAIPLYLHQLVPEYRFKIRQHHYSLFDTVLYAEI